ncbi:MAG: hypothetical protein IJ033_03845 [Clostridia bacterium]|nr:hypothetical protein [Clostridia bacterium]
MKLGEIKLEALKLMFANYNHDITIDGLVEYYADENYGSYLINMPGSINRCLSVIENKSVLPSKTLNITPNMGLASGGRVKVELLSVAPDIYLIERIAKETPYDYNGNVDYYLEGNTLVLGALRKDEQYVVVYKPTLKRISLDSSDYEELTGVPDHIACHIPYFIKGDLFREDEPNEASEARNWFEQAMSEIVQARANMVSRVESVYALVEC